MASFTVSCGETTVTMRVSGLTKGQSVRFYVRIDPGSTVYADGTYTATASSMTKTFSGLKAGTKYACNVELDNKTWIGTKYFTTDSAAIPRPSDWSWHSSIYSGGYIKLTATEWNDFTARINDFRTYKGLSKYSFTRVSRGTNISASIVNEATNAIRAMNSVATSNVYSGDNISASFFNSLKNALNNIK